MWNEIERTRVSYVDTSKGKHMFLKIEKENKK
jgi:hypothetical protein